MAKASSISLRKGATKAPPSLLKTILSHRFKTMTCTVRTYTDNGPYYGATVMSYQVARFSELLSHCRVAMEEGDDTIAVFHDDRCVGMWDRELEGHVDSAGDTIIDHDGYELRRPNGRSPQTFAMTVAKLQRAA